MRSVKLGHWVKMADTLTLPCCATGSPRNVMGGGVSPGQRRRSRQRMDPCVAKKECKERRGSGPSILLDGEELRRVKCVREGREEEEDGRDSMVKSICQGKQALELGEKRRLNCRAAT